MAGHRSYLVWTILPLLSAWALPARGAPAVRGGARPAKRATPNILADFYKNPHYKSVASGAEAPENTGCEGCHGPGSEHIAGKGDKSKIRAYSQMGVRQVLDSCLRCHAESLGRAQVRRVVALAGAGCLHRLPFDPQSQDRQIAAGSGAAQRLLRLPRECAGAILHALQAPE